jgi:uncharacterized RDD family membrane protein YckC
MIAGVALHFQELPSFDINKQGIVWPEWKVVVTDSLTGAPISNFLPGAESLPTISGFWRRICALLIDVLLIGMVGLILGLFLSDFFERLGQLGPILGFVISLTYFGIFNSSAANGQTLGKRLMKIRVVDREGKTISIPRSFARYAILGAPWFFDSDILPLRLRTSWFGIEFGFLISGMAGALIYLYVFNNATRQSLHDLILGTYVVKAAGDGRPEVPIVWKGHLYIAGGIVLLLLVGGPLVTKEFSRGDAFFELLSIQQAVAQMDNVSAVGVAIDRQFGSANSTTLIVTVRWNRPPQDAERAATQVAARVLATDPYAAQRDFLLIRRLSGYDIGIAHVSRTRNFSFTPAQWQEKIRIVSGNRLGA